jgi:predicted MFS family arabinose efflux permease
MSPLPPQDPASTRGGSGLRALLGEAFIRVTAANFTFFLSFASFFLLPQHLYDLGATKDQIGDIMAVFGLTAIPLTPLVGTLVDRFRRRPIFIGGALLMWGASTAFAWVDDLSPLIYLLRLLQGCAFACCFTAATTLAADLAPADRRAQALGIFGIFTLITHGLAVTIAEFIEAHLGFIGLFYLTPIWCLIAAVIFIPVPETRHGHGPSGGSRLLALVTSPALYPAMVVSILAGGGFGVALTFVPVLGEVIRIEHVSVFFMAYVGAAVMVRIVGGRLADVHGRRAVVLPSLVVLAGSIAGLAIISSQTGLALAGLAFGAGHGFLYPALNALVVDASRVEDRGKAMALYNAAFNLGITCGAIVFGRVAEAYGYATMFLTAGSSILCAMLFFWIRSERGA